MSDRTLQDEVVQEIKVLLVRRGWSQLQLAEQAGMKQAYLSRRMTGEIIFGLDDLRQVAEALGVHVRDLFPAEEVPAPAVSTDPRVLKRTGRRLPGSYPGRGHGASPTPSSGHVVRPDRRAHHSPDRPTTPRDPYADRRAVRLTRPAGPTRTTRAPRDDAA